ncbi:MAG: TRAP transporter small permease [Pseudolabrys sp.]|nr:TRAP transporter small permease [Pseudolabrys sp.]
MSRLFGSLLAGLNTLASVWTMFLIALISSDVIGRAVFNLPIPGVPEIVRFSIVGMVWLWMAYTLRAGKHLRTTLVLGILPPRGKAAVLALNSLVGMCLFAMILWLGWIEMAKSYAIGAFEGEHPVRIPVWPIWAILVGGAALTTIQFALDAARYLTGMVRPAELQKMPEFGSEA